MALFLYPIISNEKISFPKLAQRSQFAFFYYF